MTKKKSEDVKLELVNGVEGMSVYLNGIRIAGPKPWCGGTIVRTWDVGRVDVKEALKEP